MSFEQQRSIVEVVAAVLGVEVPPYEHPGFFAMVLPDQRTLVVDESAACIYAPGTFEQFQCNGTQPEEVARVEF